MTGIYQVSNYTPCQIGLVKGERGENGANGANGLNGKNGKDGKDGLRGLSGSDGKSLYQIALDNGFVGTFDDYQETLKGDDNYQLAVKAGFDGDYDAWVELTTANISDAAVNSILGGFVTIDSFELGATITQRNEALRHTADGKLYRWAGDLPKIVPAGSTPDSSGGVDTNAWLEVSDIALRQEVLTGELLTDALIKTVAPVGGIERTLQSKNSDTVSVKDFGAVGNGTTDDTAAIQAAFDSNGLATIYFPAGLYKVTGSGAACLTLTKNRNIIAEGRGATLRADFAGADTAILKISITDNQGLLDCRGWRMDGLQAFHNGGGKHGLIIEGGMSIVNAIIKNVSFAKGTNDAGHGLYCYNALSHSEISNSGFDTLYLKVFDANVFRKIITFGKGCAFTFDCESGVRNNTVEDCTIVNRDGQVKIINGDNIRIINNQMELAQVYSPVANQSNPAAMVHIVGVDRPVLNTIIEGNNFGGGTSLDYSIYVDNAQRTVIDKNQFIAVNLSDVHFTSKSENNILGAKNTTKGSLNNPRLGKLFKVKTSDLGVGNMGTLHSHTEISTFNSWVGSDFYKNSAGVVSFVGEFNSGVTLKDTVIGVIPKGFAPYFQKDSSKRNLLSYTEDFKNTAWVKYGITVTDNTMIAPDSLMTADTITATTDNAQHSITSAYIDFPNSADVSFSIYLKRASATSTESVRVEMVDNSTLKTVKALVNLATGTATVVVSTGSIESSSVTVSPQINGFYHVKCSFKIKPDNGGRFLLSVIPNSVSTYTPFVGDTNVHKVVLWGAQVELSAQSSEYQRVTSPTEYETVFKEKSFLATTDEGVGTVVISRQGAIKVGSLPSNNNVSIIPFQGSQNES